MSKSNGRIPVPLFPTTVRWLGVLAIVTTLFYFSILQTVSAPAQPGDAITSFWDKKLHFAAYAALATSIAYATGSNRPKQRRIVLSVGGAILYGLVVELLQAPLPTRHFSYLDLLSNIFGSLLAILWFIVESRVRYVPFPPID